MSAWSFIAQRALTGEFLDWDVPLELDGLEWALSAPGSLTATVAPDVGGLRASDGKLLLEEWGTLLYAEHGGIIRWAGILISSSFEGEAWNLEAAGFSTYPHAVTYGGEYSQIGVDPAQVIRHIWEHVQSYPDGNLNVTVLGASDTGVRLGTPAKPGTPETAPPKVMAAQQILARKSEDAVLHPDWSWPNNPPEVARYRGELLAEWQSTWTGLPDAAAWLLQYINMHPWTNPPGAERDVLAAILIRERIVSGLPILADWTWADCPSEVASHADQLRAAWQAQRVDPVTYLNRYLAAIKSDDSEADTKRVAATATRDRFVASLRIHPDWSWDEAPPEVFLHNNDLVSGWRAAQTEDGWLSAFIESHADEITKATEPTDPEPYALSWFEDTNCGEEIDALAKEGGLDWYEHHYWDAAHENVLHEVHLAHPRAGRRREDLIFSQGDNVISAVTVESNGDDFANEIVGLGAGEGRSMLRRVTSIRDGRLRRVHVVADKSITSESRLDAEINAELNWRRAAIRVESVKVIDHPNAPIGSWQLGDDVLIRVDVPWLGEVSAWCRITGWTLTSESTATLTLVRSDLYRYGGTP